MIDYKAQQAEKQKEFRTALENFQYLVGTQIHCTNNQWCRDIDPKIEKLQRKLRDCFGIISEILNTQPKGQHEKRNG